jgi:hypothetical protein
MALLTLRIIMLGRSHHQKDLVLGKSELISINARICLLLMKKGLLIHI